jgi:iron complex outermembrane recepter protein
MKCTMSRKLLSISVMLASGLAAGSAVAQLEEVVVTAQKRVESLQDTPLSVAAYSETMLENQGISTLSDLSIQAPSLQSYDFPTSTSNISLFLRGFGNTDSQTLTIDNPVGLYIDGVYIARTSGAAINVLDLERVEILRGPQGTLFGRNASAGAISLITKKPAAEFGAEIEVGAGDFGSWNAGITADLPIDSERLRTKISYHTSERDGWVENKPGSIVPPPQGQPTEDFYQNEQEGARFAVAWDVTENLAVDYAYDWADADSTAPYYQQDARKRQEKTSHLFLGGTAFQYVLPESNTEQTGHNLTISWDISDNLTLKSITGYREMEETAIQNWSDTLFFATALDWETEAFSQELQLLGTAFDDKLNYIVGLYYFEEDGEKAEAQFTNAAAPDPAFWPLDALAEPGVSGSVLVGGTGLGIHTIDTELESQAIFVQGTFTPDMLDSRLSITAGLRYTEDERDAVRGVDPADPSIQFAPGSNSLDYDRTDYTLSVDYAFTDSINAYARIATGYRAGGSGERTLSFDLTFDEEESTSYELGLKSEFFDSRLRVNAALFFTQYDDLILTLSGRPPTFASFVENVNAGEADVDGFELDVIGLITDNTTLTFNYAYLDTELNDVVVPDDSFLGSPAAGQIPDLRGVDITDSTFIPFAPDNALSIALDHQWVLGGGASMDFHVNYAWRDELFSQSGMGLPVDSLGQLGARVALSNVQWGGTYWTLAVWGKNLTDEEEVVYNLSNFGFQYNMPRWYGVDLKVAF